MNKNLNAKRPTQFQRTMIAMEKAGAVRKDGKSTAVELTDPFRESTEVIRHEEIEDARDNARLDAQAEREDQIEYEWGDDEP